MLVIPGRRHRVRPSAGPMTGSTASPESITTGRGLWIQGSPPSAAPRDDQAAHMIGLMGSLLPGDLFHESNRIKRSNPTLGPHPEDEGRWSYSVRATSDA